MAPRSEDPKLIIRVITFELVQPICSRYVNVTDGRTDRQTDGRTTYDSNTALALRASRGKNVNLKLMERDVERETLVEIRINRLSRAGHLLLRRLAVD